MMSYLPSIKRKKGLSDQVLMHGEDFMKALNAVEEDQIRQIISTYMDSCREVLRQNQTELRKLKMEGKLSAFGCMML